MVNTFGIPIIPKNDEERLNALRRYDMIDSDLHPSLDNIASLMAQTFNVPIALISLVDEVEVFFKGNVGMEGVEKSSRGVSLCALSVMQDEVTVFENANEAPCLLSNPLVAGKFGLQFYAGAPLTTHDGFHIGTACIVDKKPRKFSEAQRKMLQQFSRLVMNEFDLLYDARQKIAIYNSAILSHQQMLINRTTQLALAQEMARMASWEWIFTEKEIKWSPEMYHFWQFEEGEIEVTLEKIASLTHPDDLPLLQNAVRTVMSGVNVEIQYRRFDKNGKEIFIHTKTLVRKDENGLPVSVFGIDLDVSEIRAAQDKLSQQNARLLHANHELNSFSFIASHHLKEPLRKMQTFATRILKEDKTKLSEPSIHYIDRMIFASTHMQSLVDSLLDFSRISNAYSLATATVDLQALIDNLRQDYSDSLARVNCTITAHDLPAIFAHEENTKRLFANLFENSIKFARTDVPLSVTISAKKTKKNWHGATNQAYWEIKFADNGIGFEQIYKEKIFEIFQQLHPNSEYRGTGIGLAICKKIMQAHNGHIEAKGILGEGATFTVYFPAKTT